MLPARGDNECIIGKEGICTGNFFDTREICRVRHNNEAGKKIVQMADEFIRKAVSFIADVFFLVFRSR